MSGYSVYGLAVVALVEHWLSTGWPIMAIMFHFDQHPTINGIDAIDFLIKASHCLSVYGLILANKQITNSLMFQT